MSISQSSIGHLSPTAICDSLTNRTIDFVWESLPLWRNDDDRSPVDAENALNGQFHDFLSARANREFPMIIFRHEEQQRGKRQVDLAVKPSEPVIIHGIRYTPYLPFITIEGKRLPAPSKGREREYVTGENGNITGGIQRYKLGEHGANHNTAIIVGYVQKEDLSDWYLSINNWITDLAKVSPHEWNASEKLTGFQTDKLTIRAKSTSEHPRINNCKTSKIRLLHFWIQLS